MATAKRWALSVPIDGFALPEHADLAREAERLGYSDAWSYEADGLDCFASLAPVALATGMRLGTAIANVFTRGPATLAMSAATVFEERAAIIEYGAGVPRSWAESFARLDIAEHRPDFSEKAWRELIEDGGRFLDRWANDAARLGWTALDVFGVHPAAPSTTYDAIGLVPLIRGGDVVAIGSDRATIRTQGGTLLTYLRRPQPGAIAVWELVDTRSARHRATEEVGNE